MRISVVVAGVVLATGLAGCSSSAEVSVGESATAPAASPTVEQSVAADTQTYTSEKYGFSFQYAPPFEQKGDTSWEAESGASSADSVAVFDTDGTQVGGQYRDAFVVNVYQLNQAITEADLEAVKTELESNVIPQLEQSSQDMTISDLTPVTVSGINGYQADATFSVDGTPMSSQLYFLFDGDLEYQLLTQSATDRWEELQPTFEAMVNSFTISAPAASVSPSS